MPPRTAKNERATSWTRPPLRPQPLHSVAILQRSFQGDGIKSAVTPWNLREIDIVLEPPIPKRHERPLRNSVANRGLVGKNVVEERGHIDTIGTLWRRRKAKSEQTLQTREHPSIARSLRMVHLVDYAIVERTCLIEQCQPTGTGKLLN